MYFLTLPFPTVVIAAHYAGTLLFMDEVSDCEMKDASTMHGTTILSHTD